MNPENQRFKREILGVSFLLLLGCLLVIYPFLDALILAVVTSYLLRFAHRGVNHKIQNEHLSSLLIITTALGIIFLGLYFFVKYTSPIILAVETIALDFQNNVNQFLNFLNFPEAFNAEVRGFINNFADHTSNFVRGFVTALPGMFIDLGIYVVTSIYLFKDGKRLEKKGREIIDNLPEEEKIITNKFLDSMRKIFKGVFLTQFTVAAALGLLTGIGLYLISLFTSYIPFIWLWALLVGIAALVPLFAAFMIYGPLGIYYIAFGEPFKGLLILIFGTIFINVLSEIVLRPYIGSKQMDEHPLIIFIGFVAGPLTLGLKGLILGPIILILAKEFILSYGDLVETGTE